MSQTLTVILKRGAGKMTDERKPNPIIRQEIFTVKSCAVNQYGDLIVQTTAGKEHKIGKKRDKLFYAFQPGQEVTVGYANYMNKDYIAEASPTGGGDAGHLNIQPQSQQAPTPAQPGRTDRPGAEIGMWWGQLGEMLRAKDIDTSKPAGLLMRSVYYAQMCEVLGIKIEKEGGK